MRIMRRILAVIAGACLVLALVALPAIAQSATPASSPTFDQVFAVITAVGLAFGPLAIGVTKLVDGVKHLIDASNTMDGWVWVVLAFALGIGTCFLFHINVLGPIVAQVPRLSDMNVNGAPGEIVTGLGVAGMASYWHEHLALRKAQRVSITA